MAAPVVEAKPLAPDHKPPSAPGALQASAPTQNRVELAWKTSSDDRGVSRYEVRRDGRVIATTQGLAAADVTALAAQRYCYTAVAIDGAGNRSRAAGPACVTTPDLAPPTTPTAVSALATSERQIAVRWSASTDDVRVAGYEVLSGGSLVAKLGGTHTVVTTVRALLEHCFTVRALDGAGNRSPESAPACATPPDETAPSVPAKLQGTALSDVAIRIEWAVSTDNVAVTGYDVARDGAPLAKTAEPRLEDGGLSPARRYCYTVRAYDGSGNTSAATRPLCVTTPDLKPPAPPAVIRATARPHEIALDWEAATDDVGVKGYELLREGAVLTTTAETRALDGAVADALTYCYTVRAFDAAGNRSPPSPPVCAATPDVTPPTVPADPQLVALGETDIELRWGPSTDSVRLAGYEVVRGERVLPSTLTTLREGGLSAATRYCYGVRALDAAGNRSAEAGPVCVTTPDLTPPTPPERLVVSAKHEDALELSWAASHDNVGVLAYDVEREGAPPQREKVTSFRDEGLRSWTEYCYRVRALDGAGNRSRESRVCARTPDETPPPAPSRVLLAPKQTGIGVGWIAPEDNSGIARYEVQRDGLLLGRPAKATWEDSGLRGATRYCYRVFAFDNAGNRSKEAGSACASTLDPDVPGAPKDLRIVRSGEGLDLSWSGATQRDVVYRVYQRDRAVGATRFVTYRVKGAPEQERACFQVTAVDDRGHESPKSNEICTDPAVRL